VANVMGGLTGAATRPIMLRIAYQCVQAVKIPVIGCGGIATAADALEFLLAGCSAIQVGTANFVSPTAMPRMIDELTAWCRRHGVTKLTDIIGAVRMHEPADLRKKVAV
jgi:dihydroorotate dehydrogenase (NAD+) catalytic subunit